MDALEAQLKAARLESPDLTIKQVTALFSTEDKDKVRKTYRRVTKVLVKERVEQEQVKVEQEKVERHKVVVDPEKPMTQDHCSHDHDEDSISIDEEIELPEPSHDFDQGKRNAAIKSYKRYKIPKSMPSLYSGPPLWLNQLYNPSHFDPDFKLTITLLRSNSSQRESFVKWRYLKYCYGFNGEQVKRTFKEHKQIHSKAGFKLIANRYYPDKMTLDYPTLKFCRSSPCIVEKKDFTLPTYCFFTCGNCKQITENECICGFTYCSIPCQLAHYKEHKDHCNRMISNQSMYFQVTKEVWEDYFLLHPQERIERHIKY